MKLTGSVPATASAVTLALLNVERWKPVEKNENPPKTKKKSLVEGMRGECEKQARKYFTSSLRLSLPPLKRIARPVLFIAGVSVNR